MKKLFEEFPPVSPSDWEKEITKDLKGKDVSVLDWKPYEGFTVKPFYTAEDMDGLEYLTGALPGEFPYVRGAAGGRNPWRIDELVTAPSPAEANKLALDAIENGADSLTFICDVRGGAIYGIPLRTASDMTKLLKKIPLEEVAVNFRAGDGAAAILALFLIEAEKRGADISKLAGSIEADILGRFALTGRFPGGEDESFKELGILVSYLAEHAAHLKSILVNGSVFHDSGASAVEELAFTLASGVEYMSRLTSGGLSPDTIAAQTKFSFSVGSNYFMEIAKLRAARLLWAEIMDRYGPAREESKKMKLEARTSSWNKTVFDPYVNLLRGTVEAMAASIGGGEAVSVLPLDSAYKQPDGFTLRMARNTQLILKHESYLDRVRDPASGSYYIERLTDSIAGASLELFLEVEKQDGFVAAFKNGFIQERISKTRAERDARIAARADVFVGVNQYPNTTEKEPDISGPVSETALKRGKKPGGPFSSVAKLKERLSKKGATLGDAVPEGDSEPVAPPLTPYRGAAAFESLRLKTIEHAKKTGETPAVYLLPIGSVSMRNARATFSTNFFGCAGFRVVEGEPHETVESSAEDALRSGARIIVICSSDKEYPELAPEICKLIKDGNSDAYIVVAGNPKEHIEELRAAGVDDFIHAHSNAAEALEKFQRISGIDSVRGDRS
ncbi:MAG TPA: methylmalonyl-CoA mutase family protein [Thermodesulfobacteriota bacterium]|nr:methylmalonyl-CoA mutase family protein [Thermodesulfobacteriota bacterium]